MRVRHPHEVGHLIRDRRRRLGWSQHVLASKAGVGRQWLVELEKGKASAPLHLLLRALDSVGLALDVYDDGAARLPRPESVDSGSKAEFRAYRDGEQARGEDAIAALCGPLGAGKTGAGEADKRSTSPDQPAGLVYQLTNFDGIGVTISRDDLYQPEYRAVIKTMVTHIVRSEGPVFDELVARRVARAHGLARATRKLLLITRELTESTFARSKDDEKDDKKDDYRVVVWPDRNTQKLSPFRHAAQDVRDHSDVPLAELASLAATLLAGHTSETTAELMSRRMGLKRMSAGTRSRFKAAAELARSQDLVSEL